MTDRLLPWLALASFLPPALAVVWAAMTGRDALAVVGLLWVLATATLLVWVIRRLSCVGR